MSGTQQMFNKWKWPVASFLSYLSPHMLGSSLPQGFLPLCSSWADSTSPMSERSLAGCSETAPAPVVPSFAPWCLSPAAAIANRAPRFGSQLGEAWSLTGAENAWSFHEKFSEPLGFLWEWFLDSLPDHMHKRAGDCSSDPKPVSRAALLQLGPFKDGDTRKGRLFKNTVLWKMVGRAISDEQRIQTSGLAEIT